MRAREFTINVPITIKINGDGDPEIDMENDSDQSNDPQELEDNPVMIPPLQQDIELKKADQGKDSPAIQSLTQDEDEPDEPLTPSRSPFTR